MKTIRCTACRAEFTDEELADATKCPTCGSGGVPSLIADDVTVTINWHELRILCIWASNWASMPGFGADKSAQDSRAALQTILANLERQHPDKAPLTIMGEMRQIASMTGSDVTIVRDGQTETIKGGKPS